MLWLLGYQLQCLDVAGAHRCKVPMVKRRQLWLSEALHQGEDACVNYSNREVGVVALQLETTFQILFGRALNAVGACEYILQERLPDLCCQALVTPVVELRQNKRRHYQVLTRAGNQFCAVAMVRIRCVERCQ